MTTIFLLFLFVTQIIVFYFLALLYTKVSKYDDLEKKQRRLMDEMDDSIGAYLSELKDENDRFIEKLSISAKEENKAKPLPTYDNDNVPSAKVPLNLALQSYKSTTLYQNEIDTGVEELDDRTRAIQLHEAGQSIEEIAKALGKGLTEVELILKFR